MKTLSAYLYGKHVGTFLERADQRVVFSYSRGWVSAAAEGKAHALSVSMPIQDAEFAPDVVEAFIAGLLPDSVAHRKLLAQQLDILDDPSDFAFLSKLGRDCAGAITVIPSSERLGHDEAPSYEILSEVELEEYIRTLPQRPLLVDEDDGVLLSLAGVNDKAAVVVVKGQVALPHYGFPTTHILKPDIAGLPESIRVEHFCLQLAKACGLVVPKSKIMKAGDQVFMQMSRYDRMLVAKEEGQELVRLHQEDFCQALAQFPARKYERHGGPSWKDCFSLMRLTEDPVASTNDLLGRAIFQYLVGNPDAHAKNYSLLYRKNGAIRLAPFYDLNNAAAFRANFKKVKPLMAMAIGGEFNRDEVSLSNWKVFAKECGISSRLVVRRLEEMSTDIAKEVANLREAARGTISDAARLDIVVEDVKRRANFMLNEIVEGKNVQQSDKTENLSDFKP